VKKQTKKAKPGSKVKDLNPKTGVKGGASPIPDLL